MILFKKKKLNLVSKGTHVKLKKTKKKIHSSIPFFLHIKRCGHIIKKSKSWKETTKVGLQKQTIFFLPAENAFTTSIQ